jgi:hypothetical protein
MRRIAFIIAAGAAFALAACGQQQPAETGPVDEIVVEEEATPAPPELPPVDAALISAPNSTFTAFEPTEAGIIGAPTVREALGPLVSAEMVGEGESLHLSVSQSNDAATADIVRANMADDSILSSHVRVEFRREPEGWFPTNAYRRVMCRRGAQVNQWTTELCP